MTRTEVDPGVVASDCGDDHRSEVEISPQVGKIDPRVLLARGQAVHLLDIMSEPDLQALKKEVFECLVPRFRAIPFLDDEELLAGLLKVLDRGQDPQFPIKRTKTAKLIYDGKNTELIGRIIQRTWPKHGLVLRYDDTTADEDAAALDHAFDGRVRRASLSKSDRAFQAAEVYLGQKENKTAIKLAGRQLKSQQLIAAEHGISLTYLEDILRVRKKSKELYALVGDRKIKVRSAAQFADDEDESICQALLKKFEELSHLSDDEARRLLSEHRFNANQRNRGRSSAADKSPANDNDAATSDIEPRPNVGLAEVEPNGPNVFTASLRALLRLQRLLGCRAATPALIKALETTLLAALESQQVMDGEPPYWPVLEQHLSAECIPVSSNSEEARQS